MKLFLRNLATVSILVLYCFTTYNASASLRPVVIENNSDDTSERYSYTASFGEVNHHITSGEEYVEGVSQLDVQDIKNTPSDLYASVQTRELYLHAYYLHYKNLSVNTLINFRKADLIFPFHYFW